MIKERLNDYCPCKNDLSKTVCLTLFVCLLLSTPIIFVELAEDETSGADVLQKPNKHHSNSTGAYCTGLYCNVFVYRFNMLYDGELILYILEKNKKCLHMHLKCS